MPSTTPSNSWRRRRYTHDEEGSLRGLLDDRRADDRGEAVCRRRGLISSPSTRAVWLNTSERDRRAARAPDEREQQDLRRFGLPPVDPQERADHARRPGSARPRRRPAPAAGRSSSCRVRAAPGRHTRQPDQAHHREQDGPAALFDALAGGTPAGRQHRRGVSVGHVGHGEQP